MCIRDRSRIKFRDSALLYTNISLLVLKVRNQSLLILLIHDLLVALQVDIITNRLTKSKP